MLDYLKENLSTILIGLGLLALVIGIIAQLVRDKRRGKSSCGSGCSGCPMSGKCHQKT